MPELAQIQGLTQLSCVHVTEGCQPIYTVIAWNIIYSVDNGM